MKWPKHFLHNKFTKNRKHIRFVNMGKAARMMYLSEIRKQEWYRLRRYKIYAS